MVPSSVWYIPLCWCPSLHGCLFSLLQHCCFSVLQNQHKLGMQAKITLVCPSLLSCWCVSVLCCPLGWVTSTPTPISSLLLPTLLFICLLARHVPEPALISIPHNSVYLLRCCQIGREVRMKASQGKRARERAENRKRGRKDSENQRAMRLSPRMKGVMMVRKTW